MRLLITGGRDYMDFQALSETLDTLHAQTPVTLLIHGGARGADALSGAWAAFRDIPTRVFPADWATHGKAAGHIRNQQMLDQAHPDAYLDFPGGRGTQDMVARCRKQGVPRAIPRRPQDPLDLI